MLFCWLSVAVTAELQVKYGEVHQLVPSILGEVDRYKELGITTAFRKAGMTYSGQIYDQEGRKTGTYGNLVRASGSEETD